MGEVKTVPVVIHVPVEAFNEKKSERDVDQSKAQTDSNQVAEDPEKKEEPAKTDASELKNEESNLKSKVESKKEVSTKGAPEDTENKESTNADDKGPQTNTVKDSVTDQTQLQPQGTVFTKGNENPVP